MQSFIMVFYFKEQSFLHNIFLLKVGLTIGGETQKNAKILKKSHQFFIKKTPLAKTPTALFFDFHDRIFVSFYLLNSTKCDVGSNFPYSE